MAKNMSKIKFLITILILIIPLIIIIPKYEFAADTSSTIKLGDVNIDGKIDNVDLLAMLRHIAATKTNKHLEWLLKGDNLKAANITGHKEGDVESADTLKLQRYIAAINVPEIAKKHEDWIKLEPKADPEPGSEPTHGPSKIKVTSITLNKTSENIEKGKTLTLKATIKPNNATNKKITWSSKNKNIATVDNNGKITAKKVGITNIIATTKDGTKKSAKCKITVTQSVKNVRLNQKNITINMAKNKNVTLKATVEPSNATDKNIIWSSSNASIATVDKNGKITAKKPGKVTIIAKSKNGKQAKCTVSINNIKDILFKVKNKNYSSNKERI